LLHQSEIANRFQINTFADNGNRYQPLSSDSSLGGTHAFLCQILAKGFYQGSIPYLQHKFILTSNEKYLTNAPYLYTIRTGTVPI
jgi:hypothetical protein